MPVGQLVQADHRDEFVTVVTESVSVLVTLVVLFVIDDVAEPAVGPTVGCAELVSFANGPLEVVEFVCEEPPVTVAAPDGPGVGNEKGGQPVP